MIALRCDSPVRTPSLPALSRSTSCDSISSPSQAGTSPQQPSAQLSVADSVAEDDSARERARMYRAEVSAIGLTFAWAG